MQFQQAATMPAVPVSVKQLELYANECAARNQQLEEELVELRKVNQEQKMALASSQRHSAELRSNGVHSAAGSAADDFTALNLHCEDLTNILNALKEEEQKYLLELDELRSVAAEAQRHQVRVRELEAEVDGLRRDVQPRAAREVQLQETVNRLQAEKAQAEQAAEQSRAQVAHLRRVTESQDGRFAQQAEELAAATRRVAELEQQIKAVAEQASKREASLQKQCDHLQDLTNSHDEEARGSQQRVAELEALLRDQLEQEKQQKELETAVARLKRREVELMEQCSQLPALLEAQDIAKDEIERLRQLESSARSECERLQGTFQELQQMSLDRSRRTTAMESELNKSRHAEAENAAVIARMTRTEQEHVRQIAELRRLQKQSVLLQQEQLEQQQKLLKDHQERLDSLPPEDAPQQGPVSSGVVAAGAGGGIMSVASTIVTTERDAVSSGPQYTVKTTHPAPTSYRFATQAVAGPASVTIMQAPSEGRTFARSTTPIVPPMATNGTQLVTEPATVTTGQGSAILSAGDPQESRASSVVSCKLQSSSLPTRVVMMPNVTNAGSAVLSTPSARGPAPASPMIVTRTIS